MVKTEVLIEQYSLEEPDKVCIIDYDSNTKSIIGTTDKICSRKIAYELYDVIGEIVDGQITMFDKDEESEYEEDFDYTMYSGVEEEDD